MSVMDKEQANNATSEKVIDIIFSSLNLRHIQRDSVNASTPLTQGGLGLDSIDILELIVNFEKAFGIKLNESEEYAIHFKNIGTIVDFIASKQNG